MKKLLIFSFLLATTAVVAQPPVRLQAKANTEKTNENQNKRKTSSFRTFPTAASNSDGVVWRRDIYRELVLTKDANAVLYFPQTAQTDGRENLFNYLFKLILRKQVTAYDYKLDGNENFEAKNALTAKELMDRYSIFYEEKEGRYRVNDADLPCEEVKSYFIKESVFFDQRTATLHTRVTAICPVLHRADDYTQAITKYPMFWLNYADIAPWMGKIMLMGSNYNNAAMLSADDYFTLNRYQGDIYKVTNLQDRFIANYCPNDTALKAEHARIEKEIKDFETHLWKNDSVAVTDEPTKTIATPQETPADSVAQTAPTTEVEKTKKVERRKVTRGTTKTKKEEKSKSQEKKNTKVKTKTPSPKASSGLSVRRQRR